MTCYAIMAKLWLLCTLSGSNRSACVTDRNNNGNGNRNGCGSWQYATDPALMRIVGMQLSCSCTLYMTRQGTKRAGSGRAISDPLDRHPNQSARLSAFLPGRESLVGFCSVGLGRCGLVHAHSLGPCIRTTASATSASGDSAESVPSRGNCTRKNRQ